ncbi:hypothetical protein KIN20_024997 [Parelaphostrongylus tenuis]|uniref:Uncharacterized protein n=1 Tax=Parelaphostrongylus tenuis TaxID=148309 RepID=A0AAD5MXR0_PARTN|nr:hypothetical protein KIN20_024997 [Parelaphostrongylus tenuis]
MVIATPCNNLAVMSTIDESTALFVPLHQSIKKDPTRFKLTEEEQIYWTILRHAHSTINNGGLRGLEEIAMIGNRMGMLQIVATKGGDDEDMEMFKDSIYHIFRSSVFLGLQLKFQYAK